MDPEINPHIIRSKRRTIGLEIATNGTLIVRAPIRISVADLQKIIDNKKDWIKEKQHQARLRYQSIVPRQFAPGEEFFYLGQRYPLRITSDWRRPFEFNGSEFLIGDQFTRHAKRLFQTWYMTQAKDVILPRVEMYAQKAGQRYAKVSLSHAMTRWGSCNSKRYLNFNWRLVMAPLDMIDYVVAHEVAHLEELNHSCRFWAKVKTLMPDYKVRQDWFKENANQLRFV
jgi:predicted metal-dependent hydrolase